MGRTRRALDSAPATVAIAGAVTAVYVAQLAVAGSAESGAAFTVASETVPSRWLPALAPWLHSTHGHFAGNAVAFLLGGALVERRVGSTALGLFVLACGYATSVVPYAAGVDGIGIGISGVLFGLWSDVGLHHGVAYGRSARATGLSRATLVHGAVAVVGVSYAALAVLQVAGVANPRPGVATHGHLLGVLAGAGWALARAA